MADKPTTYKSSTNLSKENEARVLEEKRRQEEEKKKTEQYFEVPFAVPRNHSIEMKINYPIPVDKVPFILYSLLQENARDFDILSFISKREKTHFILNVENRNIQKEITGLVLVHIKV